MTDDQSETEPTPRRTPPPPRRKASPPKRTPPPRRGSNGNGADIAALVKQNQELIEQLKQAAGGGMRTVESQPEHPVSNREADADELTPFQLEVRDGTRPVPENYVYKPRNYNWPLRWFAKPDGMIVQLQGDPGNVDFYRKKGYTELSDEQERRWLGGERQKLVMMQRQKAELILTLREQLERDTDLKASISQATQMSWDHMTVAELEAFLDEVLNTPDRHGKPRRKLRPPQRLIDAENRKAEAEMKRMLDGLETSEDVSMEEFHAKIDRAGRSGRQFG